MDKNETNKNLEIKIKITILLWKSTYNYKRKRILISILNKLQNINKLFVCLLYRNNRIVNIRDKAEQIIDRITRSRSDRKMGIVCAFIRRDMPPTHGSKFNKRIWGSRIRSLPSWVTSQAPNKRSSLLSHFLSLLNSSQDYKLIPQQSVYESGVTCSGRTPGIHLRMYIYNNSYIYTHNYDCIVNV